MLIAMTGATGFVGMPIAHGIRRTRPCSALPGALQEPHRAPLRTLGATLIPGELDDEVQPARAGARRRCDPARGHAPRRQHRAAEPDGA
ncbi:MAG: hypothetical protein U1E76_20360 [Planctomycetota bacterium]